MTSSTIISIGEAMVELSQSGDAGLWRVGVAGDTLNTAWYLRKLLPDDWQVSYFTRVGSGEFSARLISFLEAENIGTSFVGRDPRHEIGLYAISLADGERSFSYWRDNSAARRLADDPQALANAVGQAGMVYLSGITLAILPEAGRQTMLEVLKNARARGADVVFDPNLRPRLWQNNETMCGWVERIAGVSDLILPSFDDEQVFFGDVDSAATIQRYLDCGAGQVVVKAGGAAIRFGGAEGAGLIDDLARVAPVDTTSAGDSFNAGYLAARLHGKDPAGSIRAGHGLSCQVIRYHGALVREAVAAVQATQ